MPIIIGLLLILTIIFVAGCIAVGIAEGFMEDNEEDGNDRP